MLKVVSSFEEKFVPLKSVDVQVNIYAFAAEVCIKQIFINNEQTSNPIEAVYCFPIEEQAAIYRFQATLDDGRKIEAKIEEKKTAQREYCAALRQGHGAFLLEQDEKSNDIFTISIGSLKPQSKCEIEIHYVQELDLIDDGQRIQFTLPTTIAPRYSPVSAGHGHIVSPASTTSKYVQSAPYTISFICSISSLPIATIGSPSHPIQISTNENSTTLVSLSQETTHLDRDIILNIDLKQQRTLTYTLIEKQAIMVSLVPTLESCTTTAAADKGSTTINCEYIFVVDCSGSMEDENKIGYARQAMSVFVKGLPVGSFFNIFRFGSTYEQFDQSRITISYNEQTAKQANDYINRMTANLGGTELYSVLSHLKSNPPQTNYSRQIFILTDGEISNVDEVLQLCRSISNTTRIYSFGLGSSPSRALVKGLARVTNGSYLFIPPKTHVDVAVARQMAKALEPCLTNVKIQCHFDHPDLQNYQISPSILPPIHVKQRLNVYILFSKVIEQTLSGSIDFFHDDKLLERVTFTESQPSTTLVATRLAAKSIISDLQMANYQSTSSHQVRFIQQEEDDRKQKQIQISIEHQILSPLTAFIAIETRSEQDKVDPTATVLREVPIEIHEDAFPSIQNAFSCPPYMPTSSHYSACSPCYSPASPAYSSSNLNNCFDLMLYSQQLAMNCNILLPDEDDEDLETSPIRTSFNFRTIKRRNSHRSIEQHRRRTMKSRSRSRSRSPVMRRSPNKNNDEKKSSNTIRQLIALQNFDGLWPIDNLEQVVSLFQTNINIKQIINDYKEKNSDVILSMIVMFILTKYYTDDESLWKPIVKKSITAMKNLLDKNDYDEISEKIQTFI